MSDTLRACPFCGATQTADPQRDGVGIYETAAQKMWPVEYRIWCEPCGAEMASGSREQLIAAWNTRVSLPAEGDVERVARAIAVADGKDPDAPAWVSFPGPHKFGICWRDQYSKQATAAIAAMSVPVVTGG